MCAHTHACDDLKNLKFRRLANVNTDTEDGLERATKYYQWIWVARLPLGFFFFFLLIFSYFYFPLETCITYMLGKHMFYFF